MNPRTRQEQYVGIFAVVTILAIVVSVTFLLWQMRERERKHAQLETVALTKMLMEQTLQNFQSADLVLQSVQERMASVLGRQFPPDSVATHLLLNARTSGMHQIRSIFIVDAKGVVINSSLQFPTARKSVADREYFRIFAQDHRKTLFLEHPVRSRTDNHWRLHLARPLFAANGEFDGVVVISMSLPQLENIYKVAELDYARDIALYFDDVTLIASLPHREDLIGSRPQEFRSGDIPTQANEIRSVSAPNSDGGNDFIAIGRLEKYPLLISVADDEKLSLASWRETATPIAIGATIICLFSASVAIFLIRKLAHQEELAFALRNANDLYKHTVDTVMDAIVAVDADQKIVLFNPAAERMFGRQANEAIGQPFDSLIPERFRGNFPDQVARILTTELGSMPMASPLNVPALRADGTEFPIESTVSKSTIGGQQQMTAVIRDVSELRQNEVQLRELNRQLRSLSKSLLSVREHERTRISRELHDDIGQQLTGLSLSLLWLSNRLQEGLLAKPDAVIEMSRQLDKAMASVRRLSAEYRPLILDDLGFTEALESLVSEIQKRTNLKVTLNLQDTHLIQGDELATNLFRIAQESLTNAVRHAKATEIKIDLANSNQKLVLTVSDNGQGIQEDLHQGGVGLVSMRERAISIGGSFQINSRANTGTTIEVSVALESLQLTGVEA